MESHHRLTIKQRAFSCFGLRPLPPAVVFVNSIVFVSLIPLPPLTCWQIGDRLVRVDGQNIQNSDHAVQLLQVHYISRKVFIKSFGSSQFSHKFVNLFFI